METKNKEFSALLMTLTHNVLKKLEHYKKSLISNLSQNPGDSSSKIVLKDSLTRAEKIYFIRDELKELFYSYKDFKSKKLTRDSQSMLFINLWAKLQALSITYQTEILDGPIDSNFSKTVSDYEIEQLLQTLKIDEIFYKMEQMFISSKVYERVFSRLNNSLIKRDDFLKQMMGGVAMGAKQKSGKRPIMSIGKLQNFLINSSQTGPFIKAMVDNNMQTVSKLLDILENHPESLNGKAVFEIISFINSLTTKFALYKDFFVKLFVGFGYDQQEILAGLNSQFDGSKYSKNHSGAEYSTFLANIDNAQTAAIEALPDGFADLFKQIDKFYEFSQKLSSAFNDKFDDGSSTQIQTIRDLMPDSAKALTMLALVFGAMLGGAVLDDANAATPSLKNNDGNGFDANIQGLTDFTGYGGVEGFMRFASINPEVFSSLTPDNQSAYLDSLSLDVGKKLFRNVFDDADKTAAFEQYSLFLSSINLDKNSQYYIPTKGEEFKAKKSEIQSNLINKYLNRFSSQTGKSIEEINAMNPQLKEEIISKVEYSEKDPSSVKSIVVEKPSASTKTTSTDSFPKIETKSSTAVVSDAKSDVAGEQPKVDLKSKFGKESQQAPTNQFDIGGAKVSVTPNSAVYSSGDVTMKAGLNVTPKKLDEDKNGLVDDQVKSIGVSTAFGKGKNGPEEKGSILGKMNYSLDWEGSSKELLGLEDSDSKLDWDNAKTDEKGNKVVKMKNPKDIKVSLGAEGAVIGNHSFLQLKGSVKKIYSLVRENDGGIELYGTKSLGNFFQEFGFNVVQIFGDQCMVKFSFVDLNMLEKLSDAGTEEEFMAHKISYGAEVSYPINGDLLKTFGVSYVYSSTDNEFLGDLGYSTVTSGTVTDTYRTWWFANGFKIHKVGINTEWQLWKGSKLDINAGLKYQTPNRDLGKDGMFGDRLKVTKDEVPDSLRMFVDTKLNQLLFDNKGKLSLIVNAPDGIQNIAKSRGLGIGYEHYIAEGVKVNFSVQHDAFGLNPGVPSQFKAFVGLTYEFGSTNDRFPDFFSDRKSTQKQIGFSDITRVKGITSKADFRSFKKREHVTTTDTTKATDTVDIAGIKYVQLDAGAGVNLAIGSALASNPVGAQGYFNVPAVGRYALLKMDDLPKVENAVGGATTITLNFAQSGGGVFVGQYNAVYGSLSVSFKRSITNLDSALAARFIQIILDNTYTQFVEDLFSGTLRKDVAKDLLLGLNNFAGATGSGLLTQYLNGTYSASVMAKVYDGGYFTPAELSDLANGTFDSSTAESRPPLGFPTSAPGSLALTTDTDSGFSNSDGITNLQPKITWTSVATATSYEVSQNGGTSWTDVGNVLEYQFSGLTNGTYNIQVRAKNAHGAGPATSSKVVTIDTTLASGLSWFGVSAPTAISTMYSGLVVNSSEPLKEIVSTSSSNGGTISGASINGSGNIVFDYTNANSGSDTLTFNVKDAAGNTSTLTITVTLISSAPTTVPGSFTMSAASDTGISSTDLYTSDTTPTFTFTKPAGATSIEFSTNGGTTWTDIGDVTTYTIPSALTDGSYSIKVRGKNSGGVGPASTLAVNIDTTNSVTIGTWGDETPGTQGTTYNNLEMNFGTEDIYEIVSITSSAGGAISGVSLISPTKVQFNWSAPTAGSSILTFIVKDQAGNIKTFNRNVTLEAATNQAPIFSAGSVADTLVSGSDMGGYSLPLATDPESTTITYSATGLSQLGAGVTLNSSTNTLSGLITAGAGTYTIVLKATDAGGAFTTINAVFTVSSTAPTTVPGSFVMSAATDTGVSTTDLYTSNTTPTFTFTKPALATSMEFSTNGGTTWTDIGDVTTYTIPSALAAGNYSVKVRGKNATGSGPATTLSVNIDTTNSVTIGAFDSTPSIALNPYSNLVVNFAGEDIYELVSITSSAGGPLTYTPGTFVGSKGLISPTQIQFDWTLPNETTTLSFVVKDQAGNQKTLTIDVNITPLSLGQATGLALSAGNDPLPNTSDGLINTTSPVFEWTALAGATGYDISFNGGTSWIDAGAATSYTYTNMPDGTYSVVVRGKAGGGSVVGTNSSAITVEKNSVALSNPSRVSATPDTINTTYDLEVSVGKSLIGGEVLMFAVQYWNGTSRVTGGGTWGGGSGTINGSGNIIGTLTTGSYSTIRIIVEARDKWGNQYGTLKSMNMSLAGTPPVMANVADQTLAQGAAVNIDLSGSVTATNGDAITGYAIASGSLPAGLSLNTTTGVISGNPTETGTFNLTVTASDKDGTSNTGTLKIVVNSLGQVTGLTLAAGNDPLPNTSDGLINTTSPVFEWTAVSGATGYDISFNGGTSWVDAGAATSYTYTNMPDGTYSVVVRAKTAGATGTNSSAITVEKNSVALSNPSRVSATPDTINTTYDLEVNMGKSLVGGTVLMFSVEYWNGSSRVTGGGTWGGGSGTINGSGNIIGTLTTGSYSTIRLAITARDKWGNHSGAKYMNMSLAGTPPVMANVADQTLAQGAAVNINLSGSVTATNGDAITGYAIASGSLPAGLSLNTTTGVISGNPTETGTFNLTVTASDKDGTSNTGTLKIVVNSLGQVTGLTLAAGNDPLPNTSDGLINTTSPVFEWTAVSGATGYDISFNGGTSWVDAGAATSYTYTNMPDGTYSVVVRAKTAGATGTNSSAITIEKNSVALSDPSRVSAIPDTKNTTYTLEFSVGKDITGGEIVGFAVQYWNGTSRIAGGGTWNVNGHINGSGNIEGTLTTGNESQIRILMIPKDKYGNVFSGGVTMKTVNIPLPN